MNTHLLTTLACLALACQINAQQLPLLSQLQESAGVLNPAALPGLYLAFGHNTQLVATHHNQWTSIEGNPRTSQFAATALLDSYEGVVPLAGVYFVNDQVGPSGFSGLYGKIGGVISGDPTEGGLSLGLQAGVNQYRLSISDLVLRDEEPVFAADNDSRLRPDVGAGVFAYKRLDQKFVYFGLSAPQILGLTVNFRGQDGRIEAQRYRHYYAQLGALLPIGRHDFIEPVAWLKYVAGAPMHVSGTVRYQSATPLFVGGGVTTSGAGHGEIGFMLGDRDNQVFRIGYGFDYALRRYGSYAGATHELNLSYSLNR